MSDALRLQSVNGFLRDGSATLLLGGAMLELHRRGPIESMAVRYAGGGEVIRRWAQINHITLHEALAECFKLSNPVQRKEMRHVR